MEGRVCAHLGKTEVLASEEPYRTIVRRKNGASGSFWYTVSTQAMTTAGRGCAASGDSPLGHLPFFSRYTA